MLRLHGVGYTFRAEKDGTVQKGTIVGIVEPKYFVQWEDAEGNPGPLEEAPIDLREVEEIQTQRRGVLTPRVIRRSEELLGYPIGVRELRLMPYILDCMLNSQKLDPRHLDGDERIVLSKWRKAGYMEGGASGLSITREFWDILTELLLMAYVDLFEV